MELSLNSSNLLAVKKEVSVNELAVTTQNSESPLMKAAKSDKKESPPQKSSLVDATSQTIIH